MGLLISGLAIFGKVMKSQRDAAQKKVKTLKKTVTAQRNTRVAIKKAEKKLYSRVAEIKKELEKGDEAFTGAGDLADLSKRKRVRR